MYYGYMSSRQKKEKKSNLSFKKNLTSSLIFLLALLISSAREMICVVLARVLKSSLSSCVRAARHFSARYSFQSLISISFRDSETCATFFYLL